MDGPGSGLRAAHKRPPNQLRWSVRELPRPATQHHNARERNKYSIGHGVRVRASAPRPSPPAARHLGVAPALDAALGPHDAASEAVAHGDAGHAHPGHARQNGVLDRTEARVPRLRQAAQYAIWRVILVPPRREAQIIPKSAPKFGQLRPMSAGIGAQTWSIPDQDWPMWADVAPSFVGVGTKSADSGPADRSWANISESGSAWGQSGSILGSFCGRAGGVMRSLWVGLGSVSGRLGAVFKPFWGRSGVDPGRSWSVWGRSRPALGRSWADLRSTHCPSWVGLGPF